MSVAFQISSVALRDFSLCHMILHAHRIELPAHGKHIRARGRGFDSKVPRLAWPSVPKSAFIRGTTSMIWAFSLQAEEDTETKDWLVNVMSNQRLGSVINSRASRRFSAFDRPRASILGALSHFTARGQEHPVLASTPNQVDCRWYHGLGLRDFASIFLHCLLDTEPEH